MADVFISYAKKHAQLTEDLARDLEAEGFSTWWDTSLLPGDEFPEEIAREIDAAEAVIVIWTEASVDSPWVRAEANRAHARGKLITLHAEGLDLERVPLPFNTLQSSPVTDRAKVFAALARRGVRGSGGVTPGPAARASKARAQADGTRAAPVGVEEFVAQVWGRAAKGPSKRLMIALELLSERGVTPDEYAPPFFRLLWGLGLDIPPPHFMGFGTMALLKGPLFGIGLFIFLTLMSSFLHSMSVLGLRPPSARGFSELMADAFVVSLLVGGAVGSLFGLIAAGTAAYQRRRLGLPSWSDLSSRWTVGPRQ